MAKREITVAFQDVEIGEEVAANLARDINQLVLANLQGLDLGGEIKITIGDLKKGDGFLITGIVIKR